MGASRTRTIVEGKVNPEVEFELHVTLILSAGPGRKGVATEFTIVSDVDVAVGKGGGSPGEFVLK